ncbi:hydroxymethylglutaryl-CoA lyase [Alicyclobacillus dauci]|uniref:Hydroxymethylglutaryl-CoA lyase n=1 Tax=Alicyclobacillus dauci TaxID=1475485 RepID=A0ABY6Z340_9BACL|nr:hydroxymethylglutaryl-CoA lyase [Alicyclobacillus dauci]WAH37087.1 hydroxymethylglutaryl-CoA lyase [Alicyclobacillus dauci]
MIHITEVGPRDGLQNEKKIIPTEQKVDLLERLVGSGIKKIEAVSFVNPKVIPQMADAEEVLLRAPRNNNVLYAGLVLSRSGLERAMKTNLDVIHIAMATSDTFNQKNARRSVAESVEEITKMVTDIRSAGKPVVVCLGTAFGCPFEGDVPLQNVFGIAEKFIEAGCTEITLADTVGVANPEQVSLYVREFIRSFGSEIPLGLHFHNTRGLGIANAYAGYLSGVRRFDASIAGLGGCPFAPKAVGNVCTEDLVNMFEEMGLDTGIELSGLIETAKWIEEPIGHILDGMLIKAGLVKH